MYLVFDIGGSAVKYAVLDNDGNVYDKGKMPTVIEVENGTEILVESMGKVYDEYKLKNEIEGIAVSLPGRIDVKNGIVYGGGVLAFLDKVALADIIKERCDGINVAMENDGKCAALAEVWKGNAADYDDSIVLVFGTGIGGGIVKDKKIHHGKNLTAGEISFVIGSMTREQLMNTTPEDARLPLTESWEKMPFFWSKYATGGACFRFSKLKNMKFEEVTGEVMYKLAEEGDEEAINFLEDWYCDIASICCSLQMIYDPEIILIGGGISAQPKFVEGIKKYSEKVKSILDIYEPLKIGTCKYLNDSNLIGALYNYKQKYK